MSRTVLRRGCARAKKKCGDVGADTRAGRKEVGDPVGVPPVAPEVEEGSLPAIAGRGENQAAAGLLLMTSTGQRRRSFRG